MKWFKHDNEEFAVAEAKAPWAIEVRFLEHGIGQRDPEPDALKGWIALDVDSDANDIYRVIYPFPKVPRPLTRGRSPFNTPFSTPFFGTLPDPLVPAGYGNEDILVADMDGHGVLVVLAEKLLLAYRKESERNDPDRPNGGTAIAMAYENLPELPGG